MKGVPGPFDLERSAGLAGIGIAQVERDDTIGVAQDLQRIKGVFGEARFGRVTTHRRE